MAIRRFKDKKELSEAAAEFITTKIEEKLRSAPFFSIALSGGSTPKMLHQILASKAYSKRIDWEKIIVFFGDERFVPLDNPDNNGRMALDTLLNLVDIRRENVHLIPTENLSPEDAALKYQETLKKAFPCQKNGFPESTFDLIILGMGEDGHTLSLFPGYKEVILEDKKWCESLWLEKQKMYRITITHPVANHAGTILFLVSGKDKAPALKEVLTGEDDPVKYPAQIIRPLKGEIDWFVDEDAYSLLRET